jgi:hypothetical protein
MRELAAVYEDMEIEYVMDRMEQHMAFMESKHVTNKRPSVGNGFKSRF